MANFEETEFNWDVPLDRDFDTRAWGGTVLKMADGYAPEVRLRPTFSVLDGSIELGVGGS